MKILIHQQARHFLKAVSSENEVIGLKSRSLHEAFWELGERFPNELIGWCEISYFEDLNIQKWEEVFHHDLIMASYAVTSKFLPEQLGYVDQLPFINIKQEVLYGTWQMSSDVGGIKGETLLRFQELLGREQDFQRLINSIGKLGQQNGLFCYSAPSLVKRSEKFIETTATVTDIFTFVYAHYKTIRIFVLFWCYFKYEKSIPIYPLFTALFYRKYFNRKIDFSGIEISSSRVIPDTKTIDVIIPTMGRREYLLQVMEDLKYQTLVPRKVVVVEQNPLPHSITNLPELNSSHWPFEIIHCFIHQTGACNARNIALENVTADFVFFADDDNRMKKDILEKAMEQIRKYGVDVLTLNYRQTGESLIFDKVKQWGTFGAGNSIISGEFARRIRFDPTFEHGYGEDQDYGMQLRKAGCDIIYHPDLEILHLKAPVGGFREVKLQPWEEEQPKPSPTLMAYIKKNYTEEQIKGYKTELFLRFYRKQGIKNPWSYLRSMRVRWRKSEKWAEKVIRNASPAESTIS